MITLLSHWNETFFQFTGERSQQRRGNDEPKQAAVDILHVRLLVRGHRSDRRRVGHQTMGRGFGASHVQHHRVGGPSQSGPVPRWQVPEHRLRTSHVQRGRWVHQTARGPRRNPPPRRAVVIWSLGGWRGRQFVRRAFRSRKIRHFIHR